MSNYYSYREVKVMIAHKLMSMEGWTVYGYKEDRSDSMTDYWDPANWDGVAEKNGYILCVDVYGAAEPQEIRKYNYSGFTYDRSIAEKIKKLEAMTVERGASEAEEASAKLSIERLQRKAEEATENANKYIVVGTVPGHMAHPPKMNWHIEKDGIIITKGNGILKYAHIWKYYSYCRDMEWLNEYKKDKKIYADNHTQDLIRRGYYDSEEDARKNTERHIEDLEKDIKLIDKFESFINKIDTICGGLLGEGDGTIYEKVTVTEYKKENKVIEDTTGSIKEGQCFILKANFNYGRYKGFTYRIHEKTYEDGQKRFYAYKLNGKKTKECTGQADQSNCWWIYDMEKFLKWFSQNALAWCHIEEVKTPYEVEKVVKKTIKAEKKNATSTTTETAQLGKTDVSSYTYEVSEDTNTRTGEKIFLVNVVEKLSREEYIAVNKYIKSLGGYYSRFKHSFLFKENPAEKLNATIAENSTQMAETTRQTKNTDEKTESENERISYTIIEDQHTQTNAKIWVVKPEKELNKMQRLSGNLQRYKDIIVVSSVDLFLNMIRLKHYKQDNKGAVEIPPYIMEERKMLPKEFYPTSKSIIDKMLCDLDFTMIHSILEASAGKGDIVEALKKKEEVHSYGNSKYQFDIDCIEADQNLQHILKGKNFRVVYNDFLTYDTMKEYDLIVMNPPFSNGCKHLLNALEMQQRNGGAVVCLLNAETLKNPCTNDRLNLQRKLTEYNAKIEFIQDAFLDAERKTSVEIALVKVQLPEVHRESFILDGLRKAQERKEFQAEENTQLIDSDFFKAIVKQYQLEVEAGIKLIKEYYAMQPFILSQFGKDEKTGETIQKGVCILSLDLGNNRDKYNNKLSVNEYIKAVRSKYWTALFENKKFIGQLTNNLRIDFYNKVEELSNYDFSLYNIYQLKIDMQKKVVKGIEDTIIELFDELSHKYSYWDETSKNIHYYNGWKTNKAWIINKKVIIPLAGYNSFWNRYNPSDYKIVRKLQDIEKCFNYLDGGLTEAVDLEESLKFAEEYGETKNIQLKYFTVTFYKKGTCHITFNNEELLKKFNIFGSQHKGWLPPSYGKKTYKDMTEEEKAVVNEFEGEKEYSKVISNKDYYLFDGNNLNLLEDKTA